MILRPILRQARAAIAAAGLLAPALSTPAAAQAMRVEPTGRIELSDMMGRWYRSPGSPTSSRTAARRGVGLDTQSQGFAVVQSCRKGGPDGKLAVWKARATVAEPRTNAKIKMSFFGGVVSQDYVVVEHRREQGWLVLATANGKYLWLMSQRPTLNPGVKSQAIARIRQLGFDVGRLEFPSPDRF